MYPLSPSMNLRCSLLANLYRQYMDTKNDQNASAPDKPAQLLTTVLEQNERVKKLVEDAAGELASVNVVLKHELSHLAPPPVVEGAIKKSEIAEAKVIEASEKLTVVNTSIEREIDERHVLEFQYAAATEQKTNRALFNDRLAQGLTHAQRHDRKLAILFVDLDRFKEVNAAYGHRAGDSLLRSIAARLKESTRIDYTICRHGGDEFLYFLSEINDQKDIGVIAEKLIAAIQAPCYICTNDVDITLSIRASIGIAIYPTNGITAENLISSADAAMYRAKLSKVSYEFAS